MANPNKPKPILDILLRNQEKLVDFLSRFHTDRSEDEQFNDEKAYLIKQIKELKPIPSSSSTMGASSSATTSHSSTTTTYFGSNAVSKTSGSAAVVVSSNTCTTLADSSIDASNSITSSSVNVTNNVMSDPSVTSTRNNFS